METAILITAISALITSIVTMLTVNEMRKQRIVSHKPIIKIGSNSFELVIDKHGNWLWEKNRALQIFNFGSGVAIDIVVEWNINVDKIIQILKRYDPYNQKNLRNTGYNLSLGNSFHNIENQKRKKISAIPIFNDSNTSSSINVPTYFTDGFSQYVDDALLNRPKNDIEPDNPLKKIEVEDYIPAIIKIKYIDINNNIYNNEFELIINIETIAKPENEKNGSASLYFSINEIV